MSTPKLLITLEIVCCYIYTVKIITIYTNNLTEKCKHKFKATIEDLPSVTKNSIKFVNVGY